MVIPNSYFFLVSFIWNYTQVHFYAWYAFFTNTSFLPILSVSLSAKKYWRHYFFHEEISSSVIREKKDGHFFPGLKICCLFLCFVNITEISSSLLALQSLTSFSVPDIPLILLLFMSGSLLATVKSSHGSSMVKIAKKKLLKKIRMPVYITKARSRRFAVSLLVIRTVQVKSSI